MDRTNQTLCKFSKALTSRHLHFASLNFESLKKKDDEKSLKSKCLTQTYKKKLVILIAHELELEHEL